MCSKWFKIWCMVVEDCNMQLSLLWQIGDLTLNGTDWPSSLVWGWNNPNPLTINSNYLEDKNQSPQQLKSLLPVSVNNVSRFQLATCHNHSDIRVTPIPHKYSTTKYATVFYRPIQQFYQNVQQTTNLKHKWNFLAAERDKTQTTRKHTRSLKIQSESFPTILQTSTCTEFFCIKRKVKPFHSGMTPERASSLKTTATLWIFCSRLIAGTRSSLDSDQQPVNTSISLLQYTKYWLRTRPHKNLPIMKTVALNTVTKSLVCDTDHPARWFSQPFSFFHCICLMSLR